MAVNRSDTVDERRVNACGEQPRLCSPSRRSAEGWILSIRGQGEVLPIISVRFHFSIALAPSR